jgi:hypothetical protein
MDKVGEDVGDWEENTNKFGEEDNGMKGKQGCIKWRWGGAH